MHQPVTAFIAMRYAHGRVGAGKYASFITFINRFSVAGIALGVMALIVVVSVMNGFEGELKQRILSLVPQLVVQQQTPSQSELASLDAIRASSEYLEGEGLVQSRRGLRGVQLQGVESSTMASHSDVANHFVLGGFDQLKQGEFRVLLGQALANELSVRQGDQLRLLMAGNAVYTPFGRLPSQRLVTVAGIFNVGSQLDDKVVYLHIEDMRRMARMRPDEPNDTRLFLHDAFDYLPTQTALEGMGYQVENWRTRQGPLFDAVKMEKNMMSVMLLLIIAVAAFNIVSALVMVVNEKQGDIAILRTQGMSQNQIMAVFMLNGLMNGTKGALIGLVLGLLVATQLNSMLALFGIHVNLSATGQGFPVDIQSTQVAMVTIMAILLSLLASVFPAYRAMKISPASALQNE